VFHLYPSDNHLYTVYCARVLLLLRKFSYPTNMYSAIFILSSKAISPTHWEYKTIGLMKKTETQISSGLKSLQESLSFAVLVCLLPFA